MRSGLDGGVQRLLTAMRPGTWQVLSGACLMLGGALLALLPAAIVRSTVDGLLRHPLSGHFLLRAGAEIVGVSLLQGLCLFGSRRLIIGMSRDVEFTLRRDFVGHMLRLPMQYFHDRRIGDLISLSSNDVGAVRMMTGPAIQQSLNTVFVFTSTLSMMLAVSPHLTLLAILPLPVVTLVARTFGRHIHERFKAVQEEFAAIASRVQETLSGIRVVRAYGQEAQESASFREQNARYLARNRRIIVLQAYFHPLLGFLTGLGVVVVLWAGGVEVIQHRMTLGAFVQFNMYLVRLGGPMVALGWTINLLQRGLASLRRLEAEWEVEPSIVDGDVGELAPAAGTLQFEDVHCRYPGRGEVLRGVTMQVRAGETLGLVGRTGCGKSTLLNLVPRLLDADAGAVKVDGMDVRRYPLAELRSRIGFVTQDAFLFSRTLAENVAFGGGADLAAVVEAAGLAPDLEVLPQGLETLIGERGVTLSGGQKQRTTLARALARDPVILLLDDAFSSVDSHTEEAILRGLTAMRRGRTTIIVSHRLSALRQADRIAVLDGGKVVAVAPHDELLATCALYRELWEQQQLEGELEQASA